MIQFQVSSQKSDDPIARGQTDNPYQVRNLLRQYLEHPLQQLTPHDLVTSRGLRIWCSADLAALMRDTPVILNNLVKEVPHPVQPIIEGPTVTLSSICQRLKIKPSKARRILRKRYGAQKLRYEWSAAAAQDIIDILRSK